LLTYVQKLKRGVACKMKPLHVQPSETHPPAEDDVYYELTLDPTQRDHRILALLIDYTSMQGECIFYKQRDHERPCTIAPEFTILGRDCNGKCFIDGLTCQLILDYVEDQKPEGDGVND
jgi:hypothetical protein